LLKEMSNEVIAFGPWRLVPAERRLTHLKVPAELSGRYFDALLLLARHPGELITKDRFMAEVWQGVPVTDEALTQCIRSLRRLLDDDAARPRFIQTVPKHGYRFIGEVEPMGPPAPATAEAADGRNDVLILTVAGLLAGTAAGLLGGLGYGLLAASDPPPGTGAISIVLVLTCLCMMVGLLGGTAVAVGVGGTRRLAGKRLLPTIAGGALGGLIIGALGRLLGLDAFTLLVGSRPIAITGGSEGFLIGTLAGTAAWFALRDNSSLLQSGVRGAGLGALAGLLVALAGGHMMAGSLAILAAAHPTAPLASLFTALMLPFWATLVVSAFEGATFVGALSVAFALAGRSRKMATPPAADSSSRRI
jgi:DNA-binding winged helix-turn-helix (wHTH) protein